jgi:hypothetical protein
MAETPIYGKKKQNALGRLPQEIVARSGDIGLGRKIIRVQQLPTSRHQFIQSFATHAAIPNRKSD